MCADIFETSVHPSAVIDDSAKLGAGVIIEAFVVVQAGAEIGAGTRLGVGAFVGSEVKIGEHCQLGANSMLLNGCKLGDRVSVGPGSVLGTDGFGYVFDGCSHVKIPQVGTVAVGDDSVIGAGTCIDRATTGVTTVGQKCELGTMVMVGHNCQIGDGSRIGDQSGLAGSSVVGQNCQIGRQCGVANAAHLGDGCQVLDRAGAGRKVAAGQVVAGFPAREVGQVRRQAACVARLAELLPMLQAES